jgi:hypothetical protein
MAGFTWISVFSLIVFLPEFFCRLQPCVIRDHKRSINNRGWHQGKSLAATRAAQALTRINAEFRAMRCADDQSAIQAQEAAGQPIQRHTEVGAGVDVNRGPIRAVHREQSVLRALQGFETARGANRQVG